MMSLELPSVKSIEGGSPANNGWSTQLNNRLLDSPVPGTARTEGKIGVTSAPPRVRFEKTLLSLANLVTHPLAQRR
jgi:hypothetical protein